MSTHDIERLMTTFRILERAVLSLYIFCGRARCCFFTWGLGPRELARVMIQKLTHATFHFTQEGLLSSLANMRVLFFCPLLRSPNSLIGLRVCAVCTAPWCIRRHATCAWALRHIQRHVWRCRVGLCVPYRFTDLNGLEVILRVPKAHVVWMVCGL